MRPLTVFAASLDRRDRLEIGRLEAADRHPRVLLYEDRLGSDVLGPEYADTFPRVLRPLVRRLPVYVAQALAAYRLRRQYGAIVTWDDRVAIILALILKLTRARARHVALMSWVSSSKKALMLRHVHERIDRLVLWSTVQRDAAINQIGVPPARIRLLPYLVDQQFWRPMPSPDPPCVCAAGNEMRDYPTFIAAVRGLDIPCHIAARSIVGGSRKLSTVESVVAGGSLPSNVVVESKAYAELRDLYSKSRFVVVPLRPTDTDNGVSTILEAMAMGKAVICSRVEGQVDVIQDGKNGIFVRQGDPAALRDAVVYLWQHPDVAERMGREGRRLVEEQHSLDDFLEGLRTVVDDVMERDAALQ